MVFIAELELVDFCLWALWCSGNLSKESPCDLLTLHGLRRKIWMDE